MKILCATDLLAKSEAAVQRAGMLADRLEADLTLLHVVTPSQSERVLEQSLRIAIVDMKSRAQRPFWRACRKPNIAVRTGSPGRIIIDVLSQSTPGLLILGPHRKRPIRDALEGTVAEKTLTTRKCPVLVVHRQPSTPYQRVLFATDPSSTLATAVRAAEPLVFPAGEDAQLVHACLPAHEGMSLYCQSDAGARYEIVIEKSCIPATVLRTIDQFRPDLLVMGTRGRGRVPRSPLGSVANRILREVACDTLIVPEGSFSRTQEHDRATRESHESFGE